jgi:PDZ domain-containing protein
VVLVMGALLTTALVVAAFFPVPYYSIGPGDARSVNDRIEVSGATIYPPDGDSMFVTVGVNKLTALGAALGWLDPNADVVEQRRILGDRTPEESREENLQLMSYSKDFATYVALTHLGFPVDITGGGVVIDSLCMQPAADGQSCAEESPASAVLDPKDLITRIGTTDIHLPDDIAPALEGRSPGDVVPVTFERGDDPAQTADVTLTAADDGRTILGIVPNPSPPTDISFSFPIDVQIDSGQVGGPSAGLAFTLALLDELTPGDLNGGATVAATGTIDTSGNVGEIGGIRQKVVAVKRSGATLFLVPKSLESIAAAEAAGSSLEVRGVETIDDALAVLAEHGGNALQLGTPGASAPAG